MSGHWKSLSRTTFTAKTPPLLIKYEIENSSYTIYLTDLVHIWTEQLTAKDIRRRALNSDTSIDPSEDQGQMRRFLQCVDDALSQKSGTSLNLDYSLSNERLLLKTHTPLPGGLQPLEWFAELKLDSTFILTRELIVPLLHRQAIQQADSSSLQQMLKEKDAIIDKCIDTLVADGKSLSKVFPGTALSRSASQSNPRQALSKQVRGLAKFNEQEWHNNSSSNVAQPSDIEHLLDSVPLPGFSTVPQALSIPDLGEWWLDMNNRETQPSKNKSKSSFPVAESQDTEGESEFQRQPTPPKPAARAIPNPPPTLATANPPPASDVSTTDSDDSDDDNNNKDDSSHPTKRPPSHALASRPSQTNHNDTPPLTSDSPPSLPTPTHPPPPPDPLITTNTTTTAATIAPKARLGKIGGKRPPPPDPPTSHSPPIPTPYTQRPTSPPQPPFHSHPNPPTDINKSNPLPPPSPFAAQAQPNPPEPTEPTPSAAETEKERADRKRAVVKRELEAKAAAGGKKKVRRF